MDPFSSSPPPWNLDDDFVLKNAVEGGASLESLAKGVVSFSRRYSVTELTERWHSLLYDYDVSDEASAAMINLELAKPNSDGIKEAASADIGIKKAASENVAVRKRKTQTLRKQYYAMRKRLRTEVFFNSFDMALHDEMCIETNATEKEIVGSGNTNDSLNKDASNSLLVNSLVNYGKQLRLVSTRAGSSHSMSEDPLWKTMEDVSAPNMPVHASLENENGGSDSKEMITHVSDALFNLPNEDELMFMNIEEKDETAANKQSDANVVGESQKLVAETQLAMANGPSAELKVVANSPASSHGDSDFVADCGNEVQSSSAAQSSHPKPANEYRLCSLNTEDSVPSPSNDIEDVNESTAVPNSVNVSAVVIPNSATPKSISIVKEVGYPDSSIRNQRRNEPDRSLKRKDTPSNSIAASQSDRPGLVPNIISTKKNHVAAVPKTENPAKNSISAVSKSVQPGLVPNINTTKDNPAKSSVSAVSRQSNNVNINQSQSRLVHATMKHASYGQPAQEVIIALPSPVNTHPKEEEHKTLPDLEAKLLCIDQEIGDDDDESDDDDANDDEQEIPYFSDVEGMILEMDLGPTDQDTDASTEVSRFQNEETKRTIMRLEQGSQAFLGRAMESRGALAVLHGRTMKEYIIQPEVIIGRSTDEVNVDIDLARAGQYAHNISRRQASIKLEADGSFLIRNLGKRSIFLNGKEVPTGQLRGLSSGSLIQIRALDFIFDVNKKCVEKFIENENERREIEG